MSLKYKAIKKVTKLKKSKQLDEIIRLLNDFKYIIVADLIGLRSSEIQEIRKIVRNYGILKVAKNNLVKIAIEKKFGKQIRDKIDKLLTNQNCFIFTNINPYELYLILEKNKIYSAAQPGMKAPIDIIVPAGNTGLTPGPILSKFSKLKVPTKIEEGSVWIAKDTIVAKQGTEITKEIVELLNLLNIKPISKTLNLKFAFDGRNIIEKIVLDIEEIRKEIIDAYNNALKIALNNALPVKETLPALILSAQMNSIKLLQNMVLPEKESLSFNLIKAQMLAKYLLDKLNVK